MRFVMQMDFMNQAYWVQKTKTEFGLVCPALDITLFQISKDKPRGSNQEVKVNPFNMEKAKTIRDTFDLGKLDWAIVLIRTEPERHQLEEEVLNKIKAFTRAGTSKPSAALTKQLQKLVEVGANINSLCCGQLVHTHCHLRIILLQKANSGGISMVFDVAAGNHSVWAALEHIGQKDTQLKEDDLRFRKTIVFKSSDLTPNLRLILAGSSGLFCQSKVHL